MTALSAPRFWMLDSSAPHHSLAGWAEGEVRLLTKVCPDNPAHTRIGKRTSALSVILPNAPLNVVKTWNSEFLIDDTVAAVLQKANVKKYELAEIAARYRTSTETPRRFRELLARGWGGMARPESGIRLLDQCDHCGRTVYSPLTHPQDLIDLAQWDGSDMFVVWPLPKFIFVTDRVRQLFENHKFRGASFLALARFDALPVTISVDMTEFAKQKLHDPRTC